MFSQIESAFRPQQNRGKCTSSFKRHCKTKLSLGLTLKVFSCCFGSFFVTERVNELHELIVDALFKATPKRNLQIRSNFKGSPHSWRLKETLVLHLHQLEA